MTDSIAPTARTYRVVQPKIIYPGTPVVLLSSMNPDGSANLAPMSSFWALGILKPNHRHIDPDRWRPLLYNFRCYYGVGPELGRSFREST